MEGKAIAVCIVVGILGLLSTAVGLIFELTPDRKLAHLFYWSYDVYCTEEFCADKCAYFRSKAFFLVVFAIICVFAAQIIISISAGCGCCRGTYPSSVSKAISIFNFFCSWWACILAVFLYTVGGAKQYGVNFSSFHDISVDSHNFCYKVKHGIFAGAAISSLFAVILGIISYLTLVSGDGRRRPRDQAWNNLTGFDDCNYDHNPLNFANTRVGMELHDIPTRPLQNPI